MAEKDLLVKIQYIEISFKPALFRSLKKYDIDSEEAIEDFSFRASYRKLATDFLITEKAIENFGFKAYHRKLSSAYLNTKKAVEKFDLDVRYYKPISYQLFTEKASENFRFTIDYHVLLRFYLQTNTAYENFNVASYAHKLFHYLFNTNSAIEDFFATALGRISSHKLLCKDNVEDVEINIIAPGYDILGQCVLKKCNLKPGETIIIDSDEYIVLKNTVSIESPVWNLGTVTLSTGKINLNDHKGCYTDFIKVTAGEKIYHTETKIDNIRYQYSLFYTADTDTAFMSGSSRTLKNNGFITVPKNAEYMVLGLYKTEGYSFDDDYLNADILFWRKGNDVYKEAVYMQSGDWIDSFDKNVSLIGIQDIVGSDELSASIEYTERFY